MPENDSKMKGICANLEVFMGWVLHFFLFDAGYFVTIPEPADVERSG